MSEPPPLRPPSAPSPLLTAVLGWLVPGFGHLVVGRPGKALLYFVLVLGTYSLGLRFAEFLCVHRDREPWWLLGQALAGGPTAAVLHLTKGFELTHRVPGYDLGLLYTTAAGLLNAVAVADALGVADERRAARERVLATAPRTPAPTLAPTFAPVPASPEPALELPPAAGAPPPVGEGAR